MQITNQLKKLQYLIRKKKNIFIIAGKNSYFKSGSNIFINNILKNRNKYFYFKNCLYPDLKEIKIVGEKINKINPDIIIAIGGGSVIDIAKVSNIINLKKKSKKKYEIVTKKKKSKLIAIPLTAGSGAEVTSTAVVYINKKKISVETNYVKPDFFFLFPILTINSPRKVKGPAIFDCIAQAVESIFSLKSNNKSILYAIKSLKISLKFYFEYYKNSNNFNSKKMLIASCYAGKAINISRTIASHAISYPFTSMFNINHGKAVAITFVNVLRYNYFNRSRSISKFLIKDRFNLLFKLTNTKNINGLSVYFQKLINDLELQITGKDLKTKIKKNWLRICRGINSKRLLNNPITLNKKNIKQILLSSC